MSFQKDAGLDPATGLFVEGGPAGLSNYTHWLLQQCASPTGTVPARPERLGAQFWTPLCITLFFTVVTVAIEIVLGFWFAIIMNRTFKGRGLVRAAVLVPWAIPTAVTAKLWFFIFAFEGIANKLLGSSGSTRSCGPATTWPARFAVIIADVWKTTPFMALLILAGLQMISADVYEAAKVDGATQVAAVPHDHPAAGQAGADGGHPLPHPGRAAHVRPAGHPHRRRRQQHDHHAVHPGDQPDQAGLQQRRRPCPRITFLIIFFVASSS